ncbi:MAG: VOC family protein [Armatimonadetes bacterium]|nr:VOC family protein [Armatimonadota bacterium]
MPTLRRIPYITLWARNFQATVRFYRDVLGLPVEYEDESFVQFATEGTRLYVHSMREAPPLRPHTVEIHFEVPDVDTAAAALREKGVAFEQPPQNMPWGTRQAWCRDPEGYMVELVGPLKAGSRPPSTSGAGYYRCHLIASSFAAPASTT